ncbi:MAG: DUF1819 family protein [Ardenticatenaceae bacterium]|nr:DUF1819 family protein [Ardenticatenaceae bacterium]
MIDTGSSPQWRAVGPYLPTNSSKAGLVDETRLFLQLFAECRDAETTRQELVNGGLPQRSRETRRTIVEFVQRRLLRWNPPPWVLDDLIAFARDRNPDALRAALLVHVPRQDTLLYSLVQRVIVPRLYRSEREIVRADVQRFLDEEQARHPEITTWTHATRQKLASNLLTILRDYGLLRGTARKQIAEPIVPPEVVRHLVRLLREEGVTPEELIHHPDWQLWLWDAGRVRAALQALATGESIQ